MKRVIFILTFFLMSSTLMAGVDGFADDINVFISCTAGSILKVNLNNVEIQGGEKNGFYKGRKIVLYRKSAPIYHPVTKELITTRKIKIAEGIIESSDENTAVAGISNLIGNIDPKIDEADCMLPTTIKFVNEKPSEESDGIISILKSKLNTNKNVVISDKNEFEAYVAVSKNEVEVKLKNSSGEVIKNFIYPVSGSVSLSRDMGKIEVVKTDELQSEYHSITGFYSGNGNYVAVADNNNVQVFRREEGKLINAGITFPGFEEITNVESYDVDGDGEDEIVVSSLNKSLRPESSVLKLSGNRLNVVSGNLPYLFRTVYDGKNRYLLYQEVKSNKLSGDIFKFSKLSNLGSESDYLMKSQKYNIYNMGLGDINNDGKMDVIYINSDKKLVVSSEEKEIYKSVENYGQGAHYFLLDMSVKDKDLHGYSDKDDQLALRKLRYYVYPRLYIKDAQIFVYNNKLKFPMFPMREIYSESKVERIAYNNLGVLKKWESDTLEPRVVDIYFGSDNTKAYLLILKSVSKGILKKDNSEIILLNIY